MRQLVLLVLFISSAYAQWYSAVPTNGKFKVVSGRHTSAAAWGQYEIRMNEEGWNTLTVETNSNFDDETQATAAGFIEGWICKDDIHNSYRNFLEGQMKNNTLAGSAKDFPTDNYKWLKEGKRSTEDAEYWHQVDLGVKQYDGILQGFNSRPGSNITLSNSEFLNFQLNCELGDINNTVRRIPMTQFDLHCSSLVKLTENNQNLFVGHNTWTDFFWLLRVWKHFKLNFKKPSQVSYSSYPGIIPSNDDFFVTSQNLVVTETTNDVYNMSLYDAVTVNTVPYFIRVTVANRMATTAPEWVSIFGKFNSGTYNNQWIIVDMKKFVKGQDIKPDTLWIVEQIPGYLYGGDQSDHLQRERYWGSYNIPYYPFIYNISGYNAASGNESSHEFCARAKIFAREHAKVKTIEDMKSLMRYNQWQTDPLALRDACKGIAARCDLNDPQNPSTLNEYSPFGAIDAKITQDDLYMTAHAVSGPSWDSQPPFAWTKQWQGRPHHGHSKVYDYEWTVKSPSY